MPNNNRRGQNQGNRGSFTEGSERAREAGRKGGQSRARNSSEKVN